MQDPPALLADLITSKIPVVVVHRKKSFIVFKMPRGTRFSALQALLMLTAVQTNVASCRGKKPDWGWLALVLDAPDASEG